MSEFSNVFNRWFSPEPQRKRILELEDRMRKRLARWQVTTVSSPRGGLSVGIKTRRGARVSRQVWYGLFALNRTIERLHNEDWGNTK